MTGVGDVLWSDHGAGNTRDVAATLLGFGFSPVYINNYITKYLLKKKNLLTYELRMSPNPAALSRRQRTAAG
jgi:hypothetical protein